MKKRVCPGRAVLVRVFALVCVLLGPSGLLASEPDKNEQPRRNTQADKDDVVDLGTTVVTGTHIRGTASAGSELIVIGREAIEASGFGRVQDILEALPQNFSGGASEDIILDIGTKNSTRGQAVDLRGLGASSTLVLVNGRRQPAGGLEGSFVDIASIAASAIERIEILPDGASAIYGADAIGGVVNFILRKDYDGAETSLRYAGSDGGEGKEVQASQLLGKSWRSGHLLFGYQYYDRERVAASAGHYTSQSGDMRRFGGTDFRPTQPIYYLSNPGNILNSTTLRPAFAIPAGQDGTDLDSPELIAGTTNFHDDSVENSILPAQQMHSGFLAGSLRLGEHAGLFMDVRYSRRDMTFRTGQLSGFVRVPSTNPFYVNPFAGNTVTVGYSFGQDLGPAVQEGRADTYSATTGLEFSLGSSWETNLAVSHGRETNEWEWFNNFSSARLDTALRDTNPATAYNVFGDGSNTNPATIDFIRETVTGQGTSTLRSATLIADGDLFRLPAGVAKLAIGADYREEWLDAENGTSAPLTGIYVRATRSVGEMERRVSAAFLELALPVLSSDEPGSRRRFDLSIAGRYEKYSDFGETTNPRLGLTWTPLESLTVRGTWGTSFRAPRFNQLSIAANPSQVTRSVLPDPASPTGTASAFLIGGNNPDLKEETAAVWTAGMDFHPFPQLEVSLTYFDVDYRDKIAVGGPSPASSTLLQEEQWAEFITRNPTPEQVNAICARPGFIGTCAPAPDVIVDRRLQNLALVRLNGVDVDASYGVNLSRLQLQFGLQGTYVVGYHRGLSETSPLFDVVDTVGNPLDLRLRARLSFAFGGWTAGTYVNYQGSYDDPLAARSVDDWATIDLTIAYQFRESDSWLEGTRLQVNAINLFDEPPPFVNSRFGFDAANATEMGRVLSAQLVKEW